MKVLTIGTPMKLPHYAVIGEATKFYVWENESGKGRASSWITGVVAFSVYQQLLQAEKKEFISLIKLLMQ